MENKVLLINIWRFVSCFVIWKPDLAYLSTDLCFENWFCDLKTDLCFQNWFVIWKLNLCFENWFEPKRTWFESVSDPSDYCWEIKFDKAKLIYSLSSRFLKNHASRRSFFIVRVLRTNKAIQKFEDQAKIE